MKRRHDEPSEWCSALDLVFLVTPWMICQNPLGVSFVSWPSAVKVYHCSTFSLFVDSGPHCGSIESLRNGFATFPNQWTALTLFLTGSWDFFYLDCVGFWDHLVDFFGRWLSYLSPLGVASEKKPNENQTCLISLNSWFITLGNYVWRFG